MAKTILYLQGLTEIGGAERDLLALVTRLDRNRWNPVVACPPTGPLIPLLKQAAVPTYPAKFPAWRKLSQIFQRSRACRELAWLIESLRPALIHVNDLYWVPQAVSALRKKRIPVIATIRQDLNRKQVAHYRLRDLDRILTVSRRATDVLIAAGVPEKLVQTSYSGVDVERFTPSMSGERVRKELGIPQEAPVLVSLGNVLKVKGIDVLLHAFRDVKMAVPSIYLIIVGRDDSTYAWEMRVLASELGVTDRVHFAGYQEDVRPFLAASDLVVLASRAEALGIGLLEAMAMGKPVVATRVGGTPEVVEEGRTGILVESAMPSQLAAAIVTLLREPVQMLAMGRAGRARAADRFHVEQATKAVEAMYDTVLAA